jgi:hypothetical protein
MSKQDIERPTPLEAVPEPEQSDASAEETKSAPVVETAPEDEGSEPEAISGDDDADVDDTTENA